MEKKIINAVLDNMKDLLIPKQLDELSSVLVKELTKYDIVERGSDEDVRNKEMPNYWMYSFPRRK